MTIKSAILPAIIGIAMMTLLSCGNGTPDGPVRDGAGATEQATLPQAKTDVATDYDGNVSKPGAPFAMRYRIIGTPIVGSPVTVELRVESLLPSKQVAVDYRINDASAMMLHEAQPSRVMVEPAGNENFSIQRISVVPQREGRMYLNVSASIDSDDGAVSSIMAIPIQVGTGGRQIEEHGEVQVDEDGEVIRVLTND